MTSEVKDPETLAAQLVDKEIEELRKCFIRFTELYIDEYSEDVGPADARVIMKHVLFAMIDSHGEETTSSITDTHPREIILERVQNEMKNVKLGMNDLIEEIYETGEIDQEKWEAKKFNNHLPEIITEYFKQEKIPLTRYLEHDNFTSLCNFLSLLDEDLDTLIAEKKQIPSAATLVSQKLAKKSEWKCNGRCLSQKYKGIVAFTERNYPCKQNYQPLKCRNYEKCGSEIPLWMSKCNKGICGPCLMSLSA